MKRSRDITGRRFGALVVQEATGRLNRLHEPIWRLRCDCGRSTESSGYLLRAGITRNCGCGRGAPRPVKKEDVGELTADRWAAILRGAKRRGVQVPVSQADAWKLFLEQERRCAVTGRELTLKDAALDYHPHAPRWIDRTLSRLLKVVAEPELIKLCCSIVHAQAA